MPLYEYECPVCGMTFEQMRHFDDVTLPPCPRGHAGVRRVFAPAGIIFKGSGFYSTDYRRDGTGKDKDKDKAESTSAAKKNEAKT